MALDIVLSSACSGIACVVSTMAKLPLQATMHSDVQLIGLKLHKVCLLDCSQSMRAVQGVEARARRGQLVPCLRSGGGVWCWMNLKPSRTPTPWSHMQPIACRSALSVVSYNIWSLGVWLYRHRPIHVAHQAVSCAHTMMPQVCRACNIEQRAPIHVTCDTSSSSQQNISSILSI